MKRFIVVFKRTLGAAFLLFPFIANSQVVSWTNGAAATDWYTASNWTPATASGGWLTTHTATFNNTGSATVAGINMNTASLSIGAINITGRTRPLTIGNSGTANGTLQLNGSTINGITNVILHVSNNVPPSPLTIQNNVGAGTGSTTLILGNAVDNIILPDYPLGSITINVPISGPGKNLTLKSSGTNGSTVTLSAANTYTGLTTVNARMSRIVLNKPGGGTLPAGNDVLIQDGSMEINTNQTLNNITLGGLGSLVIGDGVTVTVTGTFYKSSPGAVSFSGAGTGRLVYAYGATLHYINNSSTVMGNEFPALYGPTNVKIDPPVGSLPFSRAVTGTLTINGTLTMGANDFTAGTVTGSGKFITNGTGKLNITNIGTTPVVFPVAASSSSYNPVTISNGQGLTYGVRVDNSITPAGVINTNNCVNRSWSVTPVGPLSASPVNIAFYYTGADINPGFNLVNPVDVGRFTSSWQGVQTGITQIIPLPASVVFMLPGSANTFVIGNTGSVH